MIAPERNTIAEQVKTLAIKSFKPIDLLRNIKATEVIFNIGKNTDIAEAIITKVGDISHADIMS